MSFSWPRGHRFAGLAIVTLMALPLQMSMANSNPPTVSSTPARMAPEPHDPHVGLEEVMGEAALTWVRQRNAQSEAVLQADPRYEPLRRELLEVLDARDRIPMVSRRGEWLYSFWQDATHPRGLWRRTTMAEYRKPDPKWEVLLDLDALGKAEGQSWVWQGSSCFSASSTHPVNSMVGPAMARSRARSRPSPTTLHRARNRLHAAIARSIRLYGIRREVTRK